MVWGERTGQSVSRKSFKLKDKLLMSETCHMTLHIAAVIHVCLYILYYQASQESSPPNTSIIAKLKKEPHIISDCLKNIPDKKSFFWDSNNVS